jgi:3-mercaptopyruvate sulfurtransferase SseA
VAFGLALLGRDNVAIYNNSLMEWSADERLPMEDPSAKGG